MNSTDVTQHHIVKYRTYILVLLGLLTFTGLSILVTSVELGPIAVGAALLFSSFKTTLVLTYFMHLKFDKPIFTIMVSVALFIFLSLLLITMLDYLNR